MATRDLNLALRITADAKSGLDGVSQTRAKISELAQEIREKIGKIDAFTKAAQQADVLSKGLEEAKRKVEFLRRSAEGVSDASALKELAKDTDRAKREAISAEKAFNKQQSTVRGLEASLNSAGVDTRNLASEQARLTTALAATARAKELQTKLAGQAGAREQAAAEKAAANEAARYNAAKARAIELEAKLAAQVSARLAREALAAEKANISGITVVRRAAEARDLNNRLYAQFQTQQLPDVTQTMREGMRQTQAEAGLLSKAIKGLAVAATFREFIQANAQFEGMTKALESVSGSADAAQRDMAFVRSEAQRVGVVVGVAAESFTSLSASAKGTALEGEPTRKIWSAVAESMSRLGKSSGDTQGALIAISQMMSKGTVASEELRGQLGERLPGAFQIAARAMGVSTAELSKMLENGQVMADDFLPKFADELSKTFGGGEIDTFNANMARLKNTLNDIALSVGDTGVFKAMSQGLKYVAVVAATAWEAFELFGKAFGNLAYTLSTGDFSGYQDRQKANLKAARDDVSKVIEKLFPLEQGMKGVGVAAAEMGAKTAAAVKAMAEAVKKELPKAVGDAIKDYERLAEKVREAWQKSADAQQDYLDKAKAADAAAASARAKDSSIEGQASALLDVIVAQEKLMRLQAQGANVKDIETQAEVVRNLAGNLDDQARAQEAVKQSWEAVAAANRKAAEDQKNSTEGLKAQWENAQKIVDDLKIALESIGKKTSINIESDQAKAVLAQITADLDALKDKTITVKVVRLGSDGQPMDDLTQSVPGHALGTVLPGYGGGDRRLILAEDGEAITRKESVAFYGRAFFAALNARAIPRFAAGGLVTSAAGGLPALATFGAASRRVDVNLNFAGGSYPLQGDTDVVEAMIAAIEMDALKRGSRRTR